MKHVEQNSNSKKREKRRIKLHQVYGTSTNVSTYVLQLLRYLKALKKATKNGELCVREFTRSVATAVVFIDTGAALNFVLAAA